MLKSIYFFLLYYYVASNRLLVQEGYKVTVLVHQLISVPPASADGSDDLPFSIHGHFETQVHSSSSFHVVS